MLGGVAMIFLRGQHGDELAASIMEFAKFADFRAFERFDGRGHDFAEMGQDGGINRVGFGELAGAFGEIADLAGVDDDGGHPFAEQRADGALASSVCLLTSTPMIEGTMEASGRKTADCQDPRYPVRAGEYGVPLKASLSMPQ